MRKRQAYLLLFGAGAVGVVAVLLLAVFNRSLEPTYAGRRLSQWVLDYADYASATRQETAKIDEAIRQIGTNGIPHLLEWISYEPPAAKTKRLARINRLLNQVHRGWELPDQKLIRADWAVLTLTRLHPQPDQCIRELSRIVNDPKASHGAGRASEVLAGLGEAGLPALLASLTNGPAEIRGMIVIRIGSVGTNAHAAIPALRSLLTDPDKNTRLRAAKALQRIDPESLEDAVKDGF